MKVIYEKKTYGHTLLLYRYLNNVFHAKRLQKFKNQKKKALSKIKFYRS